MKTTKKKKAMTRPRTGADVSYSSPGRGVGAIPGAPPSAETPPFESITIENVYPELNCGRFPVKRIVGDSLLVWADIFRYGSDKIKTSLRYRKLGSDTWSEVPMQHFDNDRWVGSFVLDEIGIYEYSIDAWTDTFATSMRSLQKWVEAGEDISADLRTLHGIMDDAISNAGGADRSELVQLLDRVRAADDSDAVVAAAAAEPRLSELVTRYSPRADLCSYRVLRVIVDRPAARFAAWYEMFHRSQGTIHGRSATFEDCERRLPDIQSMGFDVVYLPPIHPIGRANRRGRNNSPDASEDDPGSPWAIGSKEGGHTEINPNLGTLDDFRHLLETARQINMEIAIDLALQASPDHPYVKEHPEWFFHRSDGTIRYAENPPKKYFDIYPLRFDGGEGWREIWQEVLRVVLFWVGEGVKTFRVDNPHTKPPGFWEWLIYEVKQRDPEVLFLAEAFTRPKLMKLLAKLGFDESYTYFTWKNTKRELLEFLNEFVVTSETAEYYRGNFFTNTPDILSEYLQTGGRAAFKIRLILAATLSSLYGIYNGFELCENTPRARGSEEYLDSEKYQYKVWDWERPGNIKDLVTKINFIRRSNPALQFTRNLRLLSSSNESILFYGKWTEDRSNVILVALNLDPFRTQESMVSIPIHELGIGTGESYAVLDLLTQKEFMWRGESNYVKLDPNDQPAHVLQLLRKAA